jgi:hypothetical protein
MGLKCKIVVGNKVTNDRINHIIKFSSKAAIPGSQFSKPNLRPITHELKHR